MPLRDYQLSAVESVRKSYISGKKAPILVIPTGGGKTKTAVHIIKLVLKRNKRVLFMAHRRELITQAVRALREDGIEPGVIMPGNPEFFDRAVQVASKDSLIRRLDRWSDAFDYIVIDECHRGIAKTYTKVFVALMDGTLIDETTKVCKTLREAGINTEQQLEPTGLGKQFKYADRKGIPFVIIIGEDEVKENVVMLKNMKTGEQEKLQLVEVIGIIQTIK